LPAIYKPQHIITTKKLIENNGLWLKAQRGIARLAGVSRYRVISVIKKRNSVRCIRYCKKGKRPVVETDELWSFAGLKERWVWIWLATDRDTRQIVVVAFGDRYD